MLTVGMDADRGLDSVVDDREWTRRKSSSLHRAAHTSRDFNCDREVAGMIARCVGAGLGLLAFCITILAGVYVQNPVTTTLSRSIFALFIFFLLGLALGTAAEVVVNEHEHSREAEILKRYREEPNETDKDPASGSSTDDDQENLVVSSA
ncbi:MAG: hypothetical protein IIC02_12595 [Planctomycetes bacterium]|nr:hypothetical protein [Planctomycetota bacterium]